jgi:hypothetical protein
MKLDDDVSIEELQKALEHLHGVMQSAELCGVPHRSADRSRPTQRCRST